MNKLLKSGISIFIIAISASPSDAGPPLQETKLVASDGEEGDWFGNSLSASGNTIAIGSHLDDGTGSVYIYSNDSSGWVEQQKLVASDADASDGFGVSVAISAAVVVIGAPTDEHACPTDPFCKSGSAYVFTENAATWAERQKLISSDTQKGDLFGQSVAISGDTIVIGAPHEESSGARSGSAYVFVRSGSAWAEQQKLTASDGAALDEFGSAVSISGDTIVVGARFDQNAGEFEGSAYVFVRNNGSWTEQQKLVANDSPSDGQFGSSVSVYGHTAVVGAHLDNDLANDAGSAYVFLREGTSWTQQQKLYADDASTAARFGWAVSVFEDSCVIGALLGGQEAGSAYIFTKMGDHWSQKHHLQASDWVSNFQFGSSVSIATFGTVIGARFDDDNGNASGSAYIYSAATPSVVLSAPNSAAVYQAGNEIILEWISTDIDLADIMVLSMKRDIVPPTQTEPDGVNWFRFTLDTPNDGSELVTIPLGVALADDWRFYVRHADSGAFDGTDFTFTVADPSADLLVSITDAPDPAPVSGQITYTIDVSNAGPNDASEVTLTNTLLGSATTFVSTNQPGSCSESDGVVSCDLGAIASGGSFSTIEVTVTADEVGTVISAADVSGAEPDPDPLNNTAQEDTEVLAPASADLSVTVTDDSDPVLSGSHLTYTITVTNAGPDTAQGMSVDARDDPPGEFNPLSGAAGTGTVGCSEDPFGFPGCSLGDIEPGGVRTYTLTGFVRLDSGTLTLEAEASSLTPDPDSSDNFVIESTVVDELVFTVEAVDVQPDFYRNGQFLDIATNLELFKNGGVGRIGVVADSQSRLLLRVQVSEPGTVYLSFFASTPPDCAPDAVDCIHGLGGFDEFGGSLWKKQIQLQQDDLYCDSTECWAFVVYRAPEEFKIQDGDEFLGEREVTIQIDYDSTSNVNATNFLPLKIRRPPLVLAHGLWSEPATWVDFPLVSDPRFLEVELLDYRDTANEHFSVNFPQVGIQTDRVLRRMRSVHNLSATQVVFVGHSMGGILGRLWTQASYRRDDNYHAGDFRKLFTMDTPHLGSPLANILFGLDLLADYGFGPLADPISGGALQDLSVGSAALRGLTLTEVPSHALVGAWASGPPGSGVPSPYSESYLGLGLVSDGAADDLFAQAQYDLIVGVESQTGGIAAEAQTEFAGSTDSIHLGFSSLGIVGNTSSALYSDRISELIDTPVFNDAFDFFPAVSGAKDIGQYYSGKDVPVTSGLSITSPEPLTEVQAGQTLAVTVEFDSGIVADWVLLVGPRFAKVIETPPFEFSFDVPSDLLGSFYLRATGETPDGVKYLADPLPLIARSGAVLTGITTTPEAIFLAGTGDSLQVTVFGEFGDGVVRNITSSDTGTTYIMLDDTVAEVDLNGRVVATRIGSTIMEISNSGLVEPVPVVVVQGPRDIFSDGFESGDLTEWSQSFKHD